MKKIFYSVALLSSLIILTACESTNRNDATSTSTSESIGSSSSQKKLVEEKKLVVYETIDPNTYEDVEHTIDRKEAEKRRTILFSGTKEGEFMTMNQTLICDEGGKLQPIKYDIVLKKYSDGTEEKSYSFFHTNTTMYDTKELEAQLGV
ncbi:hypothetical protein E34_1043 [Lactococcus lactis subsp. lactis]|uniref:hypothetical protein n=2 Tax=Lactococcus TaxID=1357 RepID=UPI00071C9784|nr:hypothetical protein [Lactococcus lactis]KST79092.1 hypothetical protein E34_1043 [Lactococcus lactis subsp. lactis]